jgi:uncharacterized protein
LARRSDRPDIILHLTDLTDTAADAVRSAGTFVSDLTTPALRLGVTGLSRSGKTVFITALVRTLTQGGGVPAITATLRPGFRAYLEPQPDDDVPRFAYEDHLAALAADPPNWPESTRQISQLRVTLEWPASDWGRRLVGIGRRLHVDIVDYPGEWLIDLGLLEQSFENWSAAALSSAEVFPEDADVAAWRQFCAHTTAANGSAESIAIEGARLFTAYLQAVRRHNRQALVIAPGRFLMPGDLAGTPMLTFFPIDPARADGGQLPALLKRRFESYKLRVVKPFFEQHFARLDRQIVLVDALAALNAGPQAMRSLDAALESVLRAFRPGRNSWLSFATGRRIERIVFAATKADRLNAVNHDRLRAIMAAIVQRAGERAEDAGARVDVTAIAALRATEDVERNAGADALPCIRGIPADGACIAGRRFDGRTKAVVFPGDLPADPLDAFDPEALPPGQLSFPRFRPPRVPEESAVLASPWPHVGLDRAIAFLLGDRLS